MVARSEDMVQEMLGVQDRLIRLAANRAVPIDPKTGLPGRVNVRTLRNFIDENPGLMERFPEVKQDLEAALVSEVSRKRIESVATGRLRLLEQKAAWAKLSKGHPIRIMEQTLRSPGMEKDLRAFLKVAKKGGPEAMAGFRASVLEAAMRKSTGRGGQVSLPEFKALLFDPSTPGGKSPMDVLKAGGALDDAQANLIQELLGEAETIVNSQRPGIALETLEDAPGILFDLVTRVFGAAVAGKAASASGSEAHGLIVAAGGARAAREIVQKLPNVKIQSILADLLMNDHETLAKLITKRPTAKAKLEASRLLNGYLIHAGAWGATEYVESEPESTVPQMSEAALSVL